MNRRETELPEARLVPGNQSASAAAVRIDRWLLAVRLFKTRELASAACDGGKVDVNSISARPHKPVRIGDRLRVTTPGGRRELLVRGLAERRLPAVAARALYEDLTPPAPPEPRPAAASLATKPARERGSGRPTKRDRRLTERLRWR